MTRRLGPGIATMLLVLACASPAFAQNVLIYDNSSSNNHAQTAVTDLGYTFTLGVSGDFVTYLTDGTIWDLVIIDNPSTEPSGAWTTEIDTFIRGGGAVIATSWSSTSISALASPFEFVMGSTHDRALFYRWDVTHPVFTAPNDVPDLTLGASDPWGTNGAYLTAAGSAIEIGGSTATPTAGQALIVIGNGGRTIYNGFLFDDYGTVDNDSDSMIDIVELIQNEIALLLDPDADRDADGYTIADGDCNDWNDQVHPGITTDMCDGLNNDCDSATADGESETWYGTPCDGTDADSCADGIEVCIAGAQGCNDGPDESPDICDGFDNDCDAGTADGSGDIRVGAPCDGPDLDLCGEGTGSCVAGAFVCDDATGDTPDTCDGTDDDCDPSTADGSSETYWGTACDGTDTDLCELGELQCVSGAETCVEPADEGILDVCDGIDNDCNPATDDGHDDERVGAACDGDDPDLCEEGVGSCEAGAFVCSDTLEETPELCDNIDNDCDPSTADGSGEDYYGEACDGPDADLCEEGVAGCIAGVRTCDDTTGNILDVCNGLDDDCDPMTLDGNDESWSGEPCDGPDLDLCAEGTYTCSSGVQGCDDFSSDNIELCNGVDDDCNPATSELMDADGDGYSPCSGDCNDSNSAIYPGAPEVCDGVDDDCDPLTDHDGDLDGFLDCDGDCAPMNPSIHPDAPVDCTSMLDNNCNGIVDSAEIICQSTAPSTSSCGCNLTGTGPDLPALLALLGLAAAALLIRRRR